MKFDPHHLDALAAVLRRGSFEAAADDLHVTASAISQRIKALEDRTGSALILRGAPCTGTPAGLRLAKHAEDVGLLESLVSRDLSLDQSDGPMTLRIAINADSLATWFIAALSQVPDVLFDIVVDDQDHSANWLKQGAVSAALTAQSVPVTGCEATELGALRYIATASPGFMRRWFRQGLSKDALSCAPCLTFNAKDMLQRNWIATHLGYRVSPPTHFLPSTQAFVDAACGGLGWGMNPEPLVRDALAAGRLVPLLADAPLDTPLYWQVSRLTAAPLRALTTSVMQQARKVLIQEP